LMLVAWVGSIGNRVRGEGVGRGVIDHAPIPSPSPYSLTLTRYGLAFLALGLNLFSAYQLHLNHYDTAIGGMGWLLSLVLLLGAFVGYRPRTGAEVGGEVGRATQEVEGPSADWHISRKLEIAIVLGIFALALF